MPKVSKPRRAWLVSYQDPDPSQGFSTTYLKEAQAYQAAVEAIHGWAQELAYDTDDAEEKKVLVGILNMIAAEKHAEAYAEWHAYAADTDPDQDVTIEETTVIG